MKIFNPKRLPRKQKKWIIKTWGRKTYHGLMKGYIMLVPWIIVNEPPTIMCSEGCEEEKLKEIETRYKTKHLNENFYGKINTKKIP